MRMRKKWYILLAALLCCGNPAKADESFDPMLFPDEDAAEIGSIDSYNIAPPAAPETSVFSPALPTEIPDQTLKPTDLMPMDESDLNFPEEDDTIVPSGEADAVPLNPRIQLPSPNRSAPVSETPMPKVPSPASASGPKVSPNQGLADTFLDQKAEKKVDLSLPIAKVENSWLGKITETAADKIKEKKAPLAAGKGNEELESLMADARKAKRRANASVFDVSGIMLRMSGKQVEEAMKKRGFQKVAESYEIPNFIKWRNEEKCRNNGVVGYERLQSCVVQLAKKDHHQYTETIQFSKYDTKENLSVKFTSNFTNNKVYRIAYKSLSPTITGNSAKSQYLRNIKIYDFWKKVNQKYGVPDNKDEVKWGLGGNKPYLKASSGFLLLEDPMLRELDYTRMSREDQKFINTDLYNF